MGDVQLRESKDIIDDLNKQLASFINAWNGATEEADFLQSEVVTLVSRVKTKDDQIEQLKQEIIEQEEETVILKSRQSALFGAVVNCPGNHGLNLLKHIDTNIRCNVCLKTDHSDEACNEMYGCHTCQWRCCVKCKNSTDKRKLEQSYFLDQIKRADKNLSIAKKKW